MNEEIIAGSMPKFSVLNQLKLKEARNKSPKIIAKNRHSEGHDHGHQKKKSDVVMVNL